MVMFFHFHCSNSLQHVTGHVSSPSLDSFFNRQRIIAIDYEAGSNASSSCFLAAIESRSLLRL
jgi:hypothetical protein